VSPLLKSNVIKNLNIRTGNGMGYRSIKMLEEGYYFITEKSTYGLWDLCAPDALFREIGGGCYCLNNDPINYSNAASKESYKYDIIIGDSMSSINYYLQHYKSLNKL
jgi:fructose-1,6-bisphosphatase/inositol monophosphatase family enzyme